MPVPPAPRISGASGSVEARAPMPSGVGARTIMRKRSVLRGAQRAEDEPD